MIPPATHRYDGTRPKDLEGPQNTPATTPPALRPDPSPRQLCALALERGAAVEVLERLTALAERWDATEAKKAWVAAVNGFKAECPPIFKTTPVKDRNGNLIYKFSSYDDMKAVTLPLERKWGIVVGFTMPVFQPGPPASIAGKIRVSVGSHTEEFEGGVPVPTDTAGGVNATQNMGKARSYLKRYLYVDAFDLVVAGEDSDARDLLERVSEAQAAELVDLVGQIQEKKIKFAFDAFVGQFGVTKLSDLDPKDFHSARNMLCVRLGLKPVEKS